MRVFPQDPQQASQHAVYPSLSFEPEYYHEWENRNERFLFTPFLRWDLFDDERTHADIRELMWQKSARDWEFQLGIGKVYWGVTESKHLVDIVNQTDLVESIGGQEKLGQLMLDFAWIQDWGVVDFFVLPGFRERTFPGKEGRPKSPLPVRDGEYESGAEEWHTDWAFRWSHSIGNWDLGLSHFSGTSREPRLLPHINDLDLTRVPFYDAILEWTRSGSSSLRSNWIGLELVPYYDQINQTGLDAQLTLGKWLWKFEGIHRSGQREAFDACTGGFEYTFYGVGGSEADLGVIAEYNYDSRGDTGLARLAGDIFLGTRISFNDTRSTNSLIGILVDTASGAQTLALSVDRRLGENWQLSVKSNIFAKVPPEGLARLFRKDSAVQVELAWYF